MVAKHGLQVCCFVLLRFCLDKGFPIQIKHYIFFLRFVGCSPLTIVSFVVDSHHSMPGAGSSGGGGAYHFPLGPPCTSCPYPGACPWCHVRWMLQWLNTWAEPARFLGIPRNTQQIWQYLRHISVAYMYIYFILYKRNALHQQLRASSQCETLSPL